MLASCKNIILTTILLLLTSCSTPEYKEALRAYELAKSTQDVQKLTIALSTLATLAPDEYQAEFIKAEKATTLLEQAKAYQSQQNNYAAYLSSHASYRSIPNEAAKRILISSGDKLFPLLKAKASIEHSFQTRPKQLAQLFKQYSKLPVGDWDLIKVNASVAQLSKAVIALQKALDLIPMESNIPEIALWQKTIEHQITIVIKARDYFSNLALNHSANSLKILNNNLSAESSKLLSLLRSNFAKESMKPSFIKAKNKYVTFQNLIENLSLAANLSTRDIHVDWYSDWKKIELATLSPKGDFENYPLKKEERNRQLDTYLELNKIDIPRLDAEFSHKEDFYKKFPEIISLTEKLNMDKALLI
jgi:hypothetical protein